MPSKYKVTKITYDPSQAFAGEIREVEFIDVAKTLRDFAPEPAIPVYVPIQKRLDDFHNFKWEPKKMRPEYQQRVIDEKLALDEKHGRLFAFFGTDLFQKLPEDEKTRLTIQSYLMGQYSNILNERIQAFV